jgi:hypothetical protein
LNLDELLPTVRQFTLRGKTYEVHAPDTEGYLKLLKIRRSLLKDGEDELTNTTQAVELLAICIPDLPRNELLKLPVTAIVKLSNLVEEASEVTSDEDSSDSLGESTLSLLSPG